MNDFFRLSLFHSRKTNKIIAIYLDVQNFGKADVLHRIAHAYFISSGNISFNWASNSSADIFLNSSTETFSSSSSKASSHSFSSKSTRKWRWYSKEWSSYLDLEVFFLYWIARSLVERRQYSMWLYRNLHWRILRSYPTCYHVILNFDELE